MTFSSAAKVEQCVHILVRRRSSVRNTFYSRKQLQGRTLLLGTEQRGTCGKNNACVEVHTTSKTKTRLGGVRGLVRGDVRGEIL